MWSKRLVLTKHGDESVRQENGSNRAREKDVWEKFKKRLGEEMYVWNTRW